MIHLWCLIDVANGGCGRRVYRGSTHYCWMFDNEASARAHMERQDSNPQHAPLEGPYRCHVTTHKSLRDIIWMFEEKGVARGYHCYFYTKPAAYEYRRMHSRGLPPLGCLVKVKLKIP
jgi:hypothetical protein